MLVIAFAPLEARFMMAAHAHADLVQATSPQTTSPTDHAHDQTAGHHHDVHHHGVHEPAVVTPVGHHEQAPHAGNASHPHNHDQDGAPDGACCGTFCHSACLSIAEVDFNRPTATMRFEHTVIAAMVAVEPNQLQRPPSHLLSI
jgi:hypothetical protein